MRIIAADRANTGEAVERYQGAWRKLSVPDPECDRVPDPDVDRASLPEVWETHYPRCPTPKLNDASLDPDGDDFPNAGEFRAGTNPCDPETDRGGQSDGSELQRESAARQGR